MEKSLELQGSCVEDAARAYDIEVDFFGKKRKINLILWIESILCMCSQIAKSTELEDIFLAIGAFLRSVTGRAVSVMVVGKLFDLLGFKSQFFDDSDFPDVPSGGLQDLMARIHNQDLS